MTIGNANRAAQLETEEPQSYAQNARMTVWKSKPGTATDASKRRRRKLQSSSRCSTRILKKTTKLPDYSSQDTEDITSTYIRNRLRSSERKNPGKSPTIFSPRDWTRNSTNWWRPVSAEQS